LAGAFIDRMVETEGVSNVRLTQLYFTFHHTAQAHLAHKTKKYGASKMDGYGEVYGVVPMNGMM
jgi:hypothetical protein